MEQVRPELIGRVRGAQRNVRYIPTGEGEALANAGKTISKMSAQLMKPLEMAAEEMERANEAKLSQALLEAEAEADRRFHEEVSSQKGLRAEGSFLRSEQIYADIAGKWSKQISGGQRYQERFAIALQRRANAFARAAREHESREVNRAILESEGARMDLNAARYVSAVSPEDRQDARSEMEGAYASRFRLMNGRVVTNDTVNAVKVGLETGVITLPATKSADGTVGQPRTIRIVDGTPGKGEISRKDAETMLANFEKQAAMYHAGLDAMHQKLVSGVLTRFYKSDDYAGARAYLEEAVGQGIVSEGDKRTYLADIERREKPFTALNVAREATAALFPEGTTDAKKSFGSSIEIEQQYRTKRKELEDQYAGDPQLRSLVLHNFDAEYTALRKRQSAAVASGVMQFYAGQQQRTQDGKVTETPLSEQRKLIEQMDDSDLKDVLLAAQEKRERAEASARTKTLDYQLDQENKLTAFKKAMRVGQIEIGGKVIMVRNAEEAKACAMALGLDGTYRKRAGDYIVDATKEIEPESVAVAISKAVGLNPGDEKIANFMEHGSAWLMRALHEMKGNAPVDQAWINQQVKGLLALKVEEEGWLWNSNNSFSKNIEKGKDFSSDDFRFSREQLDALRSYKQGVQKVRGLPVSESDRGTAQGLFDSWSLTGGNVEGDNYRIKGGK